jgi:hypothetical protein
MNMKELLPILIYMAVFVGVWLLMTVVSNMKKRNKPSLVEAEKSTEPEIKHHLAMEHDEFVDLWNGDFHSWSYQSRLDPEQLAAHLPTCAIIKDHHRLLYLTWATVTPSNFTVYYIGRGERRPRLQATGQMQRRPQGTLVEVDFPSYFKQIGFILLIAYVITLAALLAAGWPMLDMTPQIIWVLPLALLVLLIPVVLFTYFRMLNDKATFAAGLPLLLQGEQVKG